MNLIGIDVGGTTIKFGIISGQEIIKTNKLSTNTFDIVKQISNGARELVQSAGRSWDDIDGVSVGFPGLIVDDIVKDSANIGLSDCNLKDLLSKELGKRVVVKNDADMAALAEYRLGAGQGCRNMVMITLGTGVGGGIIIEDKLYSGRGGAGELGHIVVQKNGIPCNCGRKGCAEKYVSLLALDKLAKELMAGYPDNSIRIGDDQLVYASELIKAYKRNDACAIEILRRYTEDLADFLLTICNIFRPDKIVIGGGIVHAPEIVEMTAKICKEKNFGYKLSPSVDIVCSQLGNDAGIMGAVVCFENYDTETVAEVVEDSNEVMAEGSDNGFDLFAEATEKSVQVENTTDYNGISLDRINDMLKSK